MADQTDDDTIRERLAAQAEWGRPAWFEALTAVRAIVNRLRTRVADHEARIRALEGKPPVP